MSDTGLLGNATVTLVADDNTGQNVWVQVGGLVLLFTLLAGMAASVDTTLFRELIGNPRPIAVGLCPQFLMLPMLAYGSVKLFQVDEVTAVALLSTCMAPGGAFSNWFCSIFNADLTLSVAMTTVSTVLALAALPFNMFLYIEVIFDAAVVLDWPSLVASVSSAAAGLIAGLLISAHRPQWRRACNIAATVAGVLLLIYGAFTSTVKAPIWNRSSKFYLQIAFPCFIGLSLAHVLARCGGVTPPQTVAIAVECGYQNTGIAMSIVMATFTGDSQGEALGVPLFYGVVQAMLLVPYCLIMWKTGHTYAPVDTPFLTMIRTNFQPKPTSSPESPLASSPGSGSSGLVPMQPLAESRPGPPTPADNSLCENDSVLKALLKADRSGLGLDEGTLQEVCVPQSEMAALE